MAKQTPKGQRTPDASDTEKSPEDDAESKLAAELAAIEGIAAKALVDVTIGRVGSPLPEASRRALTNLYSRDRSREGPGVWRQVLLEQRSAQRTRELEEEIHTLQGKLKS